MIMSGEEDIEEIDTVPVSPTLPVVSIGNHNGSRSPLLHNEDGYSDVTL